ncbi:MAG: sulfatase-like hydrolase/transferase [Planctomycetes bacterium]|nr:sulfatase-like hydrolase/transferase [Planctomycetota bacterium]
MKNLSTLLVILAAVSAELGAAEKPNVIVIMADDIGFECYSSFGSEYYSTPNIDKLASTGVRFTQAYSQPICTPSRVKIMTGRYNFRNYTKFGELDLSQPTFAHMVQANGYATAIAGKWQLSAGNLNGPRDAGFDEYCLWHFSGNGAAKQPPGKFKNKGSRYKSPTLFKNGVLVPNTEGKYGPDLVSDFICDFIERKKDEPFLVYYPMILVHNPFDPTPDSRDWEKKDKNREPIEHFREMVHYMDKLIGKIVRKLDATGLRDDTLILVTGDNGTNRSLTSPFPSRGEIQGGKGTMKDAGNRVAFVANWLGEIKPGTVVDLPVGFTDVLPTIADVTGSSVPEGSDGQSFLPLVQGDMSQARGWLFQSYSKNGPGSAPYRCFVRDATWKLYADGSLFNVPQDWLEQKPVVGPEGSDARKRLLPILDRILKDMPEELIDRKPVAAETSDKKRTNKKKAAKRRIQ